MMIMRISNITDLPIYSKERNNVHSLSPCMWRFTVNMSLHSIRGSHVQRTSAQKLEAETHPRFPPTSFSAIPSSHNDYTMVIR
jgi:hypothetical protein